MSTPLDASGAAPDLSLEPTLRGLRAGQKVFSDRYTLLRILGRGGMGVVWLAHDDELGQDVALKFLPEFVALDRAALDALKEETKRSLELTHPNIVRTYTFHSDRAAEMAAIAMEHVDGCTLSDLRIDQQGKVFEAADAQFTHWIGQLCGALAYAHARKRIVHRDLKPSNLMINSEGEMKVSDFGIARSLNESRTRLSRQSHGSGGTLPYMSPQQVLGERATESDDIYSLGATLYELLTGKPPFYSGEIFEQIKTQTPPPITERRAELNVKSVQPVPDAWEKAVLACLAKKPEDRPASVAALARLLNLEGQFPESAPPVAKPSGVRGLDRAVGSATPKSGVKPPHSETASRRRRLIPALLGLLLLAAASWWFVSEKPKRDQAGALVAEARAAQAKDDMPTAQRKLTEALTLLPHHSEALALRQEIETNLVAAIERALGRADSALARKDLFAAREAYAEVLVMRPDHPRATSGHAGLKDVVGGIEVRTSPVGAIVQIGGQKEATAPVSIGQLPLGKHRVLIKLDGYDPVTEEVTLHNDTFVPLDQKLVRQRGTLALQTTPPGLDFSVSMKKSAINSEDEQKYTKEGKTPASLDNLPTGDYEIKLSRPGWPEVVRPIAVRPAAIETIANDFAEGTLTLDSTPPGQAATLLKPDGSVFVEGKTPLNVKAIPTGEGYKATLKRDGWPAFEQSLTIAKGENPALTYDFAQGSITLTSEPSEAPAELLGSNGKSLASGKTPLVIKDLPVGSGYTAVIRRDGWPAHRLPITIVKGDNPSPLAEFAEGSVRIESTPPGCKFTLSVQNSELDTLNKELEEKQARYATKGLGKEENATLKARIAELQSQIASSKSDIKPRSGVTPMDVASLPTGTWKLVMSREGWPDYEKEVTVAKGANPAVSNEFGEGTVKLTSDPVGCEVWLGKRLLGKTPCEAKVPSGRINIVSKYSNLDDKTIFVEIVQNKISQADIVFGYGFLSLSTEPSGATVFLGGKKIGDTPIKQLATSLGEVDILLSKNGYENTTLVKVIHSKKETSGHFVLSALPEKLNFINDYSQGLAKAREVDRPMIVAFHASWCPLCNKMKTHVYTDLRLKPFYNKFVWVMLDSDLPSNQKFVSQFNVEAVPCWQFLSALGKVRGSAKGACSVDEFIVKLKKYE